MRYVEIEELLPCYAPYGPDGATVLSDLVPAPTTINLASVTHIREGPSPVMHDKPGETLDLCARHCLIHLAGSNDPVRVNGTIREVMGKLFPDILAKSATTVAAEIAIVDPDNGVVHVRARVAPSLTQVSVERGDLAPIANVLAKTVLRACSEMTEEVLFKVALLSSEAALRESDDVLVTPEDAGD